LDGVGIERKETMGVEYLRSAADQGSIEGQIEYAEWLLREVPGTVPRHESEHYFRLAVTQNHPRAQMRLGIALLSGMFGRFDFSEARRFFETASKSNTGFTQFATVLRDSLSMLDCEITIAIDYSASGSIFSILRSSIDESIPLIRFLNPHLCDVNQSEDQVFEVWHNIARSSIEYLLDLSQYGSSSFSGHDGVNRSNQIGQSPVLHSLPTDLLSCNSISEMIPLIFRMYSIECSLYENANHFLRSFSIRITGQFMKELQGTLRYIYLLQSSIDYDSHIHPFSRELIVYRGIRQNGKMLMPLYESMIGEVIVWPGFASTSASRDFVTSRFIDNEDTLLFEIMLHPGDVVVSIDDFSAYHGESKIFIGTSSGLMVDDVEGININGMKIVRVRLTYCLSWYNFNIDDPPAPILV
jgi:hypothetical protein